MTDNHPILSDVTSGTIVDQKNNTHLCPLFRFPLSLGNDIYFLNIYNTYCKYIGQYKIAKPQNCSVSQFRKFRLEKFMVLPPRINVRGIECSNPDLVAIPGLPLTQLAINFTSAKILANTSKDTGRYGFLHFKIPHIWVYVFRYNNQVNHLLTYQSIIDPSNFYFLRIISESDIINKNDYNDFLTDWEVAFVINSRNNPTTYDFYQDLIIPK